MASEHDGRREPAGRACRVELYGVARLVTGVKQVQVPLDGAGDARGVLRSLASRYPALVGPVICPDLSGLAEGHALSLNGLRFIVDLDTPVEPGDALILLANAAGG